MSYKQLLIDEFKMCERFVLALIDTIPSERFTEQPGKQVNHPAWTLGHLAVTADMAVGLLRGESLLPARYKALFDYGTKPSHEPGKYPSKKQLLEDYLRTHQSLLATVQATSDEKMMSEMPIEELRSFFPTYGHLIMHVMSGHEETHFGQLTGWRKAAGISVPIM
ncbi:DinB superfamily protein [Poriferisphaera corsica]|uniref:DinB superfamily protein n=1 Tax=Poriferisphaera corsica TaxID=2528020 RepID=A0A517YR62_9BACT|nr:DinB family protein [Poriferisphaera corsica]QDU32712.1 DinB superfamily protein [Poriferisphaera corsica]